MAWAFVLLCAPVHGLPWVGRDACADGLELDILAGRGVGRAGAGVVSEDGGAALFINPAGLARRDAWRMQVAMQLQDRDLAYQPSPPEDAPDATAPSIVEDRGAPTATPHIAAQGRLGPAVVGVSYLETSAVSARLPSPRPEQSPDDIRALYAHRYAGIELDHRMRTVLVGAAMRVRPWLGVGASVGVARLMLAEKRHVFAGTGLRVPVDDPERDLVLHLRATDPWTTRLNAGVLVAPLSLPLELALAVSYTAEAAPEGDVSLAPLYDTSPLSVTLSQVRARVHLVQPIIARAGIRYLGDRVSLEAHADLVFYRAQQPSWSITGVVVDELLASSAELTQVPALARARSHAVVRASADYDVVPGFVWLAGGYAYSQGASENAWLSPVLASAASHTVAVGLEGRAGGISLSIGYARTFMPETEVWLGAQRVVGVFGPLVEHSAIAGRGRYRSTSDRVGVAVDVAWE